MGISTTVQEHLREERVAGKTFQAIADSHHIAQSYVVDLINGKRPITGISLGVFDRMFPHATVALDGHAPIVASRVASPGDGDITYGDRSEELRAAIIAAIIDLDIPPDVLANVLKTVKNTEVK